MKKFQVRLSDEVHGHLKRIAEYRNISIADIIRQALEIYVVGVVYALEGKQIVWEDEETGEKTELLIPGFTREPDTKLTEMLIAAEKKRKNSLSVKGKIPP